LLISTFKELFKGNKQLFEGLYIYDKWDWSKTNPVIHLDFAEIAYKTPNILENSLLEFINSTALNYSIELINSQLQTRFAELIEKVHKKVGERVVILVDEYDKPLIDNLNNKEVYPEVKRALHDFYQVIKAKDAHEKFVILTGVSQFSGLSIFSGLNNLNDITMNIEYGTICGYTQGELESSFKEYIENTAEAMSLSKEELLGKIKYFYNGYSWNGKTYVYNPFSTLLFFSNKEFKGYWFETGTPTFLIEQIKKRNDLESFAKSQKVGMDSLRGDGSDNVETTALLFQTGYLTVKKKWLTERGSIYTLDFPNFEVKNAFLTSLIKAYVNKESREVERASENICENIKRRDSKGLEDSLRILFANIPYDLYIGKEKYYHSLFLMMMRVVGYEVEGEVHTDKGRIDAVLKKEKEIIIVEIKYSKEMSTGEMIEEALNQIKERKYYEKYEGNDVSLLGIAFGDKKEIGCKFMGV
jgi:hypothetical protein